MPASRFPPGWQPMRMCRLFQRGDCGRGLGCTFALLVVMLGVPEIEDTFDIGAREKYPHLQYGRRRDTVLLTVKDLSLSGSFSTLSTVSGLQLGRNHAAGRIQRMIVLGPSIDDNDEGVLMTFTV